MFKASGPISNDQNLLHNYSILKTIKKDLNIHIITSLFCFNMPKEYYYNCKDLKFNPFSKSNQRLIKVRNNGFCITMAVIAFVTSYHYLSST